MKKTMPMSCVEGPDRVRVNCAVSSSSGFTVDGQTFTLTSGADVARAPVAPNKISAQAIPETFAKRDVIAGGVFVFTNVVLTEKFRTLKGFSRPRVNRFNKPQRFRRRENSSFHLVHHVGETQPVLRISEGVAATGAGMSEGRGRRTEDAGRRRSGVFHEPGRKGGRDSEYEVNSIR